jgi:mycoredoxin
VAAGTTDAIIVYSTPWCGYCTRLKRQLDQVGVPYREVDIMDDAEAAARVMSVNGGNRTVPTVVFPDGSALTNPSLQEVTARLAG